MMENELSAKQILSLFARLNEELARENVYGEIYLVGGAVMCLVFDARRSTIDVDAYFEPSQAIRKAAARVARAEQVSDKWLNDAVKAYLSPTGKFAPFQTLSHLSVMTAQADYLLAMKCLAMRIGGEYHDVDDIRYLLRFQNIETYDEALASIRKFYPIEKYPSRTLYALEEILGGSESQ